ncbi:hypothetical protein AAUPMC_04354, partial [Pasteurella multocida subsp. multocida str. Anand1_cattle]
MSDWQQSFNRIIKLQKQGSDSMKKTIVALAVAAVAATSANAATVYNQDGTKVDVNGSVRLILKKEKNERGD